MMRWSTLGRGKAKGKYGNKKTVVDGIKFDSLKEARRYKELCLLQKAGEILDLKLQVPFELAPPVRYKGKRLTPALKYVADFTYKLKTGAYVVEDAKGMRTKEYRIKRHLMLSVHGIEVQEV